MLVAGDGVEVGEQNPTGDGVELGEQNRGEKREEKNRGSGMGLEVGRSPAEVLRRNTEVVGGRGRPSTGRWNGWSNEKGG